MHATKSTLRVAAAPAAPPGGPLSTPVRVSLATNCSSRQEKGAHEIQRKGQLAYSVHHCTRAVLFLLLLGVKTNEHRRRGFECTKRTSPGKSVHHVEPSTMLNRHSSLSHRHLSFIPSQNETQSVLIATIMGQFRHVRFQTRFNPSFSPPRSNLRIGPRTTLIQNTMKVCASLNSEILS